MVRPLVVASLLLAGLLPTGAPAQTVSIAARYPAVTAADRDWLRQREPIFFAGDAYHPAGPAVHFNGELMLPAGSYDGVPLYADTSVEPYSQVLVPVGRGLLQPYERRREGELAGTTGSRTPAFPVELRPDTALQRGFSWQDDFPEPGAALQRDVARRDHPGREPAPPPASGVEAPPPDITGFIVTARSPEGNRGIWIRYEGHRWESAGDAVELDASFKKIGQYRGFPVYSKESGQETVRHIYIPSREDVLAPYRMTTNGSGE